MCVCVCAGEARCASEGLGARLRRTSLRKLVGGDKAGRGTVAQQLKAEVSGEIIEMLRSAGVR